VERLVSSPAIQFKGTGWYVTDYARKGASSSDAKGEPKAEKETAKESTAASSEKSEKPKGATTPPPASTATK
jgi:predicted nucleic acid-binding Zn ribbon protein